ncbi:MAG: RNA polymerase sigma factor [Clostridia bacterium]|nr:RNA polymerase sigma factor [Clostridia bacterium]
MGFEEIYSLYKQDVFCYLCGLTGNADEAEELLAETFFRAFLGFQAFRSESSVKTWLFAIAKHVFYQHLTKRRREIPVEDTFLYPLCERGIENRSDTQSTVALTQLVSSLLAKKDERSRRAFHLRLAGYSFREIGQALGISENSARVLVHRVRLYLQTELKKEGYGNE